MTVDEVKQRRAELIDLLKDRPTQLGVFLSGLYQEVFAEIAHSPNADARALARAAIGADDGGG